MKDTKSIKNPSGDYEKQVSVVSEMVDRRIQDVERSQQIIQRQYKESTDGKTVIVRGSVDNYCY